MSTAVALCAQESFSSSTSSLSSWTPSESMPNPTFGVHDGELLQDEESMQQRGQGSKAAKVGEEATKKKVKKKRGPIICTTSCRGSQDLLALVSSQLGWRTSNLSKLTHDFYWIVTREDVEEWAPKLNKTQRISKFPGMGEMLKKASVQRLFARCERLQPGLFDFCPKSWEAASDKDMGDLKNNMKANKSGTWIVKPDGGSQGDGIFLVKSWKDMQAKIKSSYKPFDTVIQEYIEKPMLIDDLKFDLRIYVLVTSVDPLNVYLCREGLVRLCTSKYEAPTASNLHKVTGHLTNYSLNMRSDNFVQGDDEHGTGSTKRSLSSLFNEWRQKGVDIEELWDEMKVIVGKTMAALQYPMRNAYWDTFHQNKQAGPNQSFHIMGFDVLLDEDMKPHLLEINNNPSFHTDQLFYEGDPEFPGNEKVCQCMEGATPHVHVPCKVDEMVKGRTVGEALKIVNRIRKGKDPLPDKESFIFDPIFENGADMVGTGLPHLDVPRQIYSLYCMIRGVQRRKMDLSKLRRMIGKTSILGPKFAVHDVDILFVCMKQKLQSDDVNEFEWFTDLIEELALRVASKVKGESREDVDKVDALCSLLGQFGL